QPTGQTAMTDLIVPLITDYGVLIVGLITFLSCLALPVPSSLEDFLARPHAAFQFGPTFVGRLDEPVIERQDLLRNNRVLVPNFHLLPLTVLQSDCIAAVPESLARCYARQLPLTVFPLPYEVGTIHIEQVWMPRDTKSPRHRWLRDMVQQVVADTDFVGG
ncbi:MAG: LysR substrate-binding domain-containing protein, partial [Myxococcota bacterium]